MAMELLSAAGRRAPGAGGPVSELPPPIWKLRGPGGAGGDVGASQDGSHQLWAGETSVYSMTSLPWGKRSLIVGIPMVRVTVQGVKETSGQLGERPDQMM